MIKLQVQKYLPNNDKKGGKHIIALLLKQFVLTSNDSDCFSAFLTLRLNDSKSVSALLTATTESFSRAAQSYSSSSGNSHARGRLFSLAALVCNHSSEACSRSHSHICSMERALTVGMSVFSSFFKSADTCTWPLDPGKPSQLKRKVHLFSDSH